MAWNVTEESINCKMKLPPTMDKYGKMIDYKPENVNNKFDFCTFFRADDSTKKCFYHVEVQ